MGSVIRPACRGCSRRRWRSAHRGTARDACRGAADEPAVHEDARGSRDPRARPEAHRGRPGLGYGLKRAATQVAIHIELAAAAEGASPTVVAHSKHVAIAARSTAARADQLLALAQKVQAATSAADAAALVSQMVSLAISSSPGRTRMGWKNHRRRGRAAARRRAREVDAEVEQGIGNGNSCPIPYSHSLVLAIA